MSIPAWPTVLPLPQYAGYSLSRTDVAARRSLSAGPVLARQRSTRQSAAVINAALVLTDLQMAIFESWWNWVLWSGVAWFSLTLPTDGGGAAPTLITARCSDGYRAELIEAGWWRVALPLQLDSTAGA